MSVTVLNTDAGLSGKTIVNLEDAQNVTGAKSFNRSPNPPFVVQAGSAVVPNLDADKVDGVHVSAIVANRIPYATGADTLANSASLTFDATTITAPAATLSSATGQLTLTGGQIVFPATQVPSTNVNTFDDYEEGTWTPTIASTGGGAPTYTTQVGGYIKVGKVVNFWGRLSLATFGTLAAGNISLTGFPFTSENTTNQFGFVHCPFWSAFTTLLVNLGGIVNANNTTADMRTTGAAGAVATASLTKADMAATSDFIFGGSYRAAA